ncbi:MAG: hypothetical protein QOJ16_2764, partial [Acidobacteriota bacterium]|nr:hypothetical protein [Acidobacteriota bacterium]
ALGGHSLLAVRVAARLRATLGVELPVRELFESPKLGDLAARLAAERLPPGLAPPPLERLGEADRAGALPVSFGQRRLWLLDRIEPGSPAYNLAEAFDLEGTLDPRRFAHSLAEVVRRHEILRTTFPEIGGEPVQLIAPPAPVPLPVVDLSALPARRREGVAADLTRAEASRAFDLAAGPLLRATLLRLAPARHRALFCLHHMVTDGWSLDVLMREVAAAYAAAAVGRAAPLAELPLQYADWAAWQRLAMGKLFEQQLAFWREQLAGIPTLLELPADRPRRVGRTAGGSLPFALAPARTGELARLGRLHGVTPFMLLLTGFAVVLARLAGREALLVGTPIAGRRHLETENLIGLFVNTLALPVRLAPGASFGSLLGAVRATVLDAFAQQDLPFESLVEALLPERGASLRPLVQVAFALHRSAGVPAFPGCAVRRQPVSSSAAKFDLALQLAAEGGVGGVGDMGGIAGRADYDATLFDATTVERWLSHFERLLETVARAPERPWDELPLASEAERHQLLLEWNDTAVPAGEPELVPDRVGRWAATAPAAPAVETTAGSWSHGELAAWCGRLAGALRARGVGRGERVGVCLDRGLELAGAPLALWRLGAVYVPFDPAAPPERLQALARDAGLRALVTSEDLLGLWRGGWTEGAVLTVESLPAEGGESAAVALGPSDLAYLIYTSGTTGAPKAVAISHGGLAATIDGAIRTFGFGRGERMLHVSAFTFDISLFELLVPLASGGAVRLLTRAEILDEERLAAALPGVTRLHAVPSLMRSLTGALRERGLQAGVEMAFVGGERVGSEVLAGMAAALPGASRVVLYGPTEGTIVCAAERLEEASGSRIGRPLPRVELRVVDGAGEPLPIGISGELWIGGPGVAEGYWQRGELTAERFVSRDGRRFYRTGDQARFTSRGSLEFLGRVDEQVKLRGFRIEPAEIEAELVAQPEIGEAAVALWESRPGDPRLVAYLVPAPGAPGAVVPPPREVRRRLAERLPEYMLPAAFVVLDRLPRSAHGKVDRRALPAPDLGVGDGGDGGDGEAASGERAPRTPVEQVLAGVWCQVLERDAVGVDDDFFALGGHSLLASRVVARVREVLGVELPLAEVFVHTSLAGLAARIAALRGEEGAATPFGRVAGGAELPLSFAQERLWFLDQLDPGSPVYNLSLAIEVAGALAVPALAAALGEILRRHEALRTRFVLAGGAARQIVEPEATLALPAVDLTGLPEADAAAAGLAIAAAEARRPFDLSRAPLLRAGLLRLARERHVVLLTVHHIATDGWSMRVFAREVTALFSAFAAGRPSPLPEPAFQYADFAHWQRARLASGAWEGEIAYWRQRLADRPTIELPTDRPRPALRTARGAVRAFALPGDLAAAVRGLGRRAGATPFMVLFAAFAALLARTAGREEVAVGTPVAGRSRPETEGLIGFLVNVLVVRADLAGAPTGETLLGRVREAVLAALAHQDLPFDRLVQELRPERTLVQNPLFQILFVFQDESAALPALPGLGLRLLAGHGGQAKFDFTLALAAGAGGLSGRAEYALDLFDGSTVARLLGHYERLLAGLAADPGARLEDLPLLSPAERQQLEHEWNDTGAPRGAATLYGLFVAQAA